MSEYRFNVFWSEADNNYVATCPDFPGVSGFGETRVQALAEAELSLQLAIEAYQEEGWELPIPQPPPSHSGRLLLRLPRSLHTQLAQQAEVEGISLNMLACNYLTEGAAEHQIHGELRIMREQLAQLLQDLQKQAGNGANVQGASAIQEDSRVEQEPARGVVSMGSRPDIHVSGRRKVKQ